MKSSIHLCQHKAYENEALIRYEEAESASKLCFLPLLVIRRHGQIMMQNLEDDMNDCYKFEQDQFEENKASMTKDQLNSKQLKCFNDYQGKLKGMVPQINQMYEGYIQNFDRRTGQIIDINQIMKDKKVF